VSTGNGATRKKAATPARNVTALNEAHELLLNEINTSLQRIDYARRHGMSFEGARDLYKVGGYPQNLKFEHFLALYERDGTAGQIIDMPAEATWRKPPEVVEPDQEDGTEFTKAWTELAKRLHVWQRFERADRMSRIGRYSVLLIGARDGGDDRALATPLPKISKPEDVLYLQSYHEGHAKIDTWVDDATDERFGMPLTYKIDLSSGVANFRPKSGTTLVVHHSRVIHIAEGLLADEVYGREALRRVYNDLQDYQKVTTSSSEAFWQNVAGILQGVIDPDATVTPEQLDTLDDTLKELYHEMRRTFFGRGIELKRLAGEAIDPKSIRDLLEARIAAGSGMPKRILFGSETGERASTEDQKSYNSSIDERRQQHAEPAILRAFIDRLVERGALPRPGADGYEVVWTALAGESELDIAECNRRTAETAKAATAIGGSPLDLVEVDDNRRMWLRPTGERGELTPEEMEPPELPEPVLPGQPSGDDGADPDAPGDT
jgi:hypothetical protein